MESMDSTYGLSDPPQAPDAPVSSIEPGDFNDELSALREQVEHLRRALESRDLIGQAKGILMATAGCSADAAFDLLRQQSQHQNIKIVELAAEVVAQQERRRASALNST